MNRAERRRLERETTTSERKKSQIRKETRNFDAELLMTCFALANHRLWGHDRDEVMKSLRYTNDLMDEILNGVSNLNTFKRELQNEVGVNIRYME